MHLHPQIQIPIAFPVYEKDAPSIKVLTILTLPLLLEEVELSLLDNMEEASSEKAESELVSWPSVPPPLGIDRCFRNLISSALERAVHLTQIRVDGEQLMNQYVVAAAAWPPFSNLERRQSTTIALTKEEIGTMLQNCRK